MASNGLMIPIIGDFTAFEKSMQKTADKVSKMGSSLSKKLTAPLVGVGGVALKMSVDFETAMAKVSTLSDDSVKPLKQLGDEITKLSNETGISAEEIANNVYDALSAGQTTDTVMDFVANSTKLAKAGFADAGQSLDLLTTILNSYGMEASETARVSDILVKTQDLGKISVAEMSASMGKIIPTANSMGINLEQVATGYAIMTSKGIAAAEATTYQNSMFNELGKSGTKANEAVKKAFNGKTFQQLIKEGKSVGDVLGGMDKYAKKNKLSLADMFGSAEAGKAAIILAAEGGAEFNSTLEEMGDVAGSTQKNFDKMGETAGERFTRAINRAKNVIRKLGDVMLPIFASIMDAFSGLMEKLDSIPEGPRKMIVAIGVALAAIGPIMIIVSKGLSIFSKVGVLFSPVGLAIMGIVALAAGLKYAIDHNIGGAGDKFKSFVEKAKQMYEKVKAVFDNVKKVFSESLAIGKKDGAGAGIANFISQLTGADSGKVQIVFEAIKTTFENTVNAIKAVVENVVMPIVEFIIELVKQVVDIFIDLLPILTPIMIGAGILFNILMKAVEAIAPAVKFVIDIIASVVTWLVGVIQWCMPFISAVIQGILYVADIILAGIYVLMPLVTIFVDGVIAGIVFLWEMIKTLFSVGFEYIKGIIGVALSLIKRDWEGAGQGIIGIIDTLWGGIKRVFENIVNFIKGAFKSLPSEMKQAGKDIVNGLINGIKEKFSNVTQVAKELGSKVKNKFKEIMGINSPSRVFKQFGVWTGEGLAIGIDKSSSIVDKSVDGLGNIVTRAGSGIFDTFDNISSKIADMSDMKLDTTVSATRVQRYSEFHVGARREEAVIENNITLDGTVLTSELSPRFDIASGNRIKVNGRRMGVK